MDIYFGKHIITRYISYLCQKIEWIAFLYKKGHQNDNRLRLVFLQKKSNNRTPYSFSTKFIKFFGELLCLISTSRSCKES